MPVVRRLKPIAAAAALMLLAALPLAPRPEPPATDSFTLDNGLKVFLAENHNLPLVHTVVGVRVGSRDETSGTNGLVHILEHLILFRGTRTRSAEEVSRDIRSNDIR